MIEHEDGVSVSCPALRGCHSQGKTRKEALASIREAIREWLAAEADEAKLFKVSEAEVAARTMYGSPLDRGAPRWLAGVFQFQSFGGEGESWPTT